jgi:hypothetical protein
MYGRWTQYGREEGSRKGVQLKEAMLILYRQFFETQRVGHDR